MGMLDDIMKTLDRWEEWRIIRSLPNRFAEMEAKIREMEQKLGDKWPPDICRHCGERGLRLSNTFGPDKNGNMRESWNCEKCKAHEERSIKPK